MKAEIMKIVEKICTMQSTNCRSLNKVNEARKLMNIAGVPENATIHEIPLDWDNQVEILFTIPADKVHKVNYYFALYAGIESSGKFCFDLLQVGEWSEKTDIFDFYVRDKIIPADYFKNH